MNTHLNRAAAPVVADDRAWLAWLAKVEDAIAVEVSDDQACAYSRDELHATWQAGSTVEQAVAWVHRMVMTHHATLVDERGYRWLLQGEHGYSMEGDPSYIRPLTELASFRTLIGRLQVVVK